MDLKYAIDRCLLVTLLALPLTGFAGFPPDMTQAEMGLAPPYCRDTIGFAGYGDRYGNASPRAPFWISRMGEGFWGMHHYCWSVVNAARADRHTTPPSTRQFLYETVVGDIDYAINFGISQSGMKFVLLPELFTKRAEALLRLKKDEDALASYGKAIEVKEDYWPAYAGLAEYYKTRGGAAKAKEYVEQGLKFSPDSKVLNSMLNDLQDDKKKAAK